MSSWSNGRLDETNNTNKPTEEGGGMRAMQHGMPVNFFKTGSRRISVGTSGCITDGVRLGFDHKSYRMISRRAIELICRFVRRAELDRAGQVSPPRPKRRAAIQNVPSCTPGRGTGWSMSSSHKSGLDCVTKTTP